MFGKDRVQERRYAQHRHRDMDVLQHLTNETYALSIIQKQPVQMSRRNK